MRLPDLLADDKIAIYRKGSLSIFDRRRYPFEKEYVVLHSVGEVVSALKCMVTQGGGVFVSGLKGMMLARDEDLDFETASKMLSSARPTNSELKRALENLQRLVSKGIDLESAVEMILSEYRQKYERMGTFGSSLIKDGDGILTTCFPEHSFTISLMKAKEGGKQFSVYVMETRPYLQGAHLTAPMLSEMGFDVKLITDSAQGHYMQEGKISKYMTAADRFLPDGSIINKVGTLSAAISSSYFSIPYYAFSLGISENSEYVMEEGNGEDIKRVGSEKITADHVSALYPLFDRVTSDLITGVITPEGIV